MVYSIAQMIPFVILIISVVTDWKKRKIYNLVTIPGFFLGLAYVLYFKTYSVMYVIFFLFLFLIFLLVYAQRAMRGGDIKLLLTLSLFLSPGAFFFNAALFMFSAFFYFFFRAVRVKGVFQTVNDIKLDSFALFSIGENNNYFASGVKNPSFPGGGAILITLCYLTTIFVFKCIVL
jgi:Flp pilus assembly protein protease CpaA